MSETSRVTTGNPSLDVHLGGGLLPGTLTVVAGATGIGKTQLGMQFAFAGQATDGRPGIIFDVTSRGDAQNHRDYAQRMFGWNPQTVSASKRPPLNDFFSPDRVHGDYLHVFDYQGRRVTKRDLDFDAWQAWQSEVNAKLGGAIAFFYGNFVRGVRRAVIDGIEPTDRPGDSIQFELFEYVYHQILRKESEWVARDLFRQQYRAHAEEVAAHPYDPADVTCLLLITTQENMLDDLISRPLDEGDLLATANTVIYLGKVRDGARIGRAAYIAKHRGSACSEEILSYSIGDQGLAFAVEGDA